MIPAIVFIFFNKNLFADCSGCVNGSYGCSSECFAYDCVASNCDFVDENRFCDSFPNDGTSDIESDEYESHDFTDVCAFVSS